MNDNSLLAVLDAQADLAEFVARAWDVHGKHPASVAAALRARAPAVTAESGASDAIGLAEHVWLAHLGDAAGLAEFLAALPGAVAESAHSAAAVRRARWALAMLAGHEAPVLPERERWRAMQGLWIVWAQQGRTQDALAMLRLERPAALAHPDAAARRALAATCNNVAGDLREGPRGDGARDTLMLEAAEAARALWGSAGTWVHAERAEYQLARCHAARGDGSRALVHARACLATIEAHADDPQADAAERFFAHEALAWALRAAGDHAAASAERAKMDLLAHAIDDASLRAWCDEAAQAFDAGA